ncbi:M3 family metallopeptidase [Myxococcus sp. CA056]|uniref:M3 family metallopeptidase n=1 Tax=unclassified Myxococcus TaxID=2648731 RepID=UPI00157AAB77|nr:MULTISPECIES: M3 family metallopeptidase [unclassified Myxococcus]NTX14962.1 M3 family metallopeptidase [Myxococcus sp. CA056]NTX51103.1 M3 family metallopeptidase [Myxococcus sp. CA039A]
MTRYRIGALVVLLAGAAVAAPETPPGKGATLLAPWSGPHGGAPPFDRVKLEEFRPALEEAMEQERREVARVADSTEPPTFENTIAALEDTGRGFTRVFEVYNAWSSFVNTPEYQVIEREMAPRLAAFWDESTQNRRLFRRIKAVHDSAAKAKLTPEQRRLVAHYHDVYVRSGANLGAAAGKRFTALNQQLATLYTTFNQNVLADEKRFTLLETEADLAGLPEPLRKAAATEAEARGKKGQWAVANTRSAVADFLTYSDRRELREKVWRNYDSRGDHGDSHDNNGVITQILAARAEQAKLLGFPTHAHRQLATSMVKTPERAMRLLEQMWTPAVARVREEVAAMQEIARRDGQPETIAPWDYRYYAEKVRKAKYDLDDTEVKPYLRLDSLRDGMFWAAGELFGYTFTPAPDVPVYHPDVSVFAVKERTSGKPLGLLYFDPYARPGKYNGGQTETYRVQERFRSEVTGLVAISMPFVKPGPGGVALLGWRDALTLFHEFGHALHSLSASVTYPTLGGGRVVRDFGEFPAELFEHWLSTPEVLSRFAVHHVTGKPMPEDLVARIQKAATFNQGFYTVDYLTSALVEMKLHLAGARRINPDTFERDVLRQIGAPEEVGMRSRLPHFGHVFASNGYAAGYYMYLWAEMLSADAFEAFTEAGGAYDPKVAARLREHILSVGNTVDPFEGYRAFRGREASLDALMRERGFPAPQRP